MSSSNSDQSLGKRIAEEEDNHAFIHIRVDADLKQDLLDYVAKENTSITAAVTSLIEEMLYKKDLEDEEDAEDELLDLIVNSLMNLERRMEIRLATLQDTFNSLIGRLIDSQNSLKAVRPSQLRRKRKGVDEEEEETDLGDVLSINKEEEIYKRVKRFLQQNGKVMDLQSVIQQIEVDRLLKEYLDDQDRQSIGLKDALITDAIQEAAYELGLPMIDTI